MQNGEQQILKRHFQIIYIKKKKKIGPNVEPCGTLQVTLLTIAECPVKLSYCFLFFRNDLNQLFASPQTL